MAKDITEKAFYDVCDSMENATCGMEKLCKENGNISYPMFKLYIRPTSEYYDPNKLSYYTRAKDEQKMYLSEMILTLTQEMQEKIELGKIGYENVNAAVSALRVRIDSIKWLLSKLDPKKFGDKIEHSGDMSINWSEVRTAKE
jgi:hypothetical protein